jgi:hypothetical protein
MELVAELLPGAVAAEGRGVEHGAQVQILPLAGCEDAVAAVPVRDQAEPADAPAHLVGEKRRAGLPQGVDLRELVGRAEEQAGVGNAELAPGIEGSALHVERHGAVAGVEVQVHRAVAAAPREADVVLLPGAEVAAAGEPCAVLGAPAEDGRDAGWQAQGLVRRPLLLVLLAAVEEQQRGAAAVADRRLRDDDGHGQEAALVEQPLGGVELPVRRILEHVHEGGGAARFG